MRVSGLFQSNSVGRVTTPPTLLQLARSDSLLGWFRCGSPSREVRRTHFKGELLFTSALFNVSSSRPLKANFLYGHHEHSPEDHDSQVGYAGFAEILKQNNIEWSYLSLLGTNEIPAGNLLIAAGPTDALADSELSSD